MHLVLQKHRQRYRRARAGDKAAPRIFVQTLSLGLIALWFFELILGCTGCSESGDEPTNNAGVVEVQVFGPPEAFQLRKVTVSGIDFPVARPSGTGLASATVFLCTMDRARFLNLPLVVNVYNDEGSVLSETNVERFGCRLAKNPGDYELNRVWLGTDGKIDADFTTGNINVFTSCTEPSRAFKCRAEDHLL